jgi:hypothetical protein
MAMNSTYRALTRAGFNQTNFPRLQNVMFITESEAAAHYVARFYRDTRGQEFLKVSAALSVQHVANTSGRKTNTLYFAMLVEGLW